ncbi:MAG TPA: hypothetical protein VEW68_02380, partial [Patescibacteria group bacterium]|nr:hypothetical protein [Patescibacteria group bacterium]
TASSNKADEPVVVTKADPAISTTPNPTSVAGSGTLQDTASLTGGFNPAGQITFTLYDPSNTAVHTETVNVSGNGTYSTSVGHLVNTPGTWHWGAAYSGDANNSSVQSALADEPVTVTGTGDVLADTGLNPPAMIPALILMVLGFLGILAGAVAWRRRAA